MKRSKGWSGEGALMFRGRRGRTRVEEQQWQRCEAGVGSRSLIQRASPPNGDGAATATRRVSVVFVVGATTTELESWSAGRVRARTSETGVARERPRYGMFDGYNRTSFDNGRQGAVG